MSNVTYFSSGTTINIQDTANVSTSSALPVGVYLIRQHPMNGPLFLQRTDEFHPPEKIYGDAANSADRIINTFSSRKSSTGIMFTGTKGAGKTLLTKVISSKLLKSGVPTLIVDQQFNGAMFNEFIGKLNECVVIFDEFDKVFFDGDEDGDRAQSQESLLTLFDGTVESKKLFILSVNNSYRVNEFFRNRPGRIFYTLKFGGLTPDFVREYAEEKLNNLDNLDQLVRISYMFGVFTFDMLQALVEEMNRYNETAKQSLAWMNYDLADNAIPMTVTFYMNGNMIPQDSVRPRVASCDPMMNDECLYVYAINNSKTKELLGESEDDVYIELDKDTFQCLKPDGSTHYKRINSRGDEIMVILERQEQKEFNYDAF